MAESVDGASCDWRLSMKVGDLVRECGQYGIGIIVNTGDYAMMVQVKYNFHPVPLWSHINHLEKL
jgi:hypothetical protein|tara:strand:- start:189 stop:383 length:195 start_codon:yes stop_codon:yes gene_type:complete